MDVALFSPASLFHYNEIGGEYSGKQDSVFSWNLLVFVADLCSLSWDPICFPRIPRLLRQSWSYLFLEWFRLLRGSFSPASEHLISRNPLSSLSIFCSFLLPYYFSLLSCLLHDFILFICLTFLCFGSGGGGERERGGAAGSCGEKPCFSWNGTTILLFSSLRDQWKNQRSARNPQ